MRKRATNTVDGRTSPQASGTPRAREPKAIREATRWAWLGALALCAGCAHQEPTPGPSSTATGPSTVAAHASATATASVSATSSVGASQPADLGEEWPPYVVDLHVDTPWQVHFEGRKTELTEGHITPKSVQAGHYLGVAFVIYIPDKLHKNHPHISDADEIVASIDELVRRHAAFEFSPPTQPGQLGPDAVHHTTVFLTIEGAGAFAEDIEQIDRFIERGVRLIGPVHAHDNRLASSATGKGPLGLTKLGKEFCKRVYEHGALVDVSHMSDASFADLVPIAQAAGAPIVATHSNARAVCSHPRNLTDPQLEAIGKSGGVAGLNLHHSYVHRGKAKLEHVVEHVKHMVEVAGIDHVAIGTDYDGGTPLTDLGSPDRLPTLAEALVESGLSRADVRKIFSRNALRVLAWHGGPS